MRLVRFVALSLVLAPWAAAQISVTPRGDAATLDVATWNVQFFGYPSEGPNDALQLDRVEAVIDSAAVDLWGLQEVVDETEWTELLARLADDGYAGVLGPSVSGNERFDQKLAFVYDTSVIAPIGEATTILSGESYEFAGRLPLELRARVTVDGKAREVRFIVIHAKASSDPESYERREAAAAALKAYVDPLIEQEEAVVILGDYNDELTGSIRGTTFDSPYDVLLDAADYAAATLATEEAGLATFCGSDAACDGSSTIDHILYTPATLDFVPATGNAQFQRYGELLDGITQYTITTSDHLPAVASFTLAGSVAAEADPEAGPVALLAPAPSPFRQSTTLRFRLDAPADVALDVVDVLGRRVAHVSGTYGAGEHAVDLDGRALAAGLYVVRLQAGSVTKARTLVRAR